MYFSNKFKLCNSATSHGRAKFPSEILESLQIIAKLNIGDVIDDIEKRNTGTSILDRLEPSSADLALNLHNFHNLVCEPYTLGTALNLLIRGVLSPLE